MRSGSASGPARARLSTAILVLLFALAPGGARAASALRVPFPPAIGPIDAATYDEAGRRLGPAAFAVDRLGDGHVRIQASGGIEGAERTEVSAMLAPTDDGQALRPVRQESRSFDAAGVPMGVLTVDHERGVAVCAAADRSEGAPRELVLPAQERVANVVLNFLFAELARGNTERVEFQILVCRGGPRVMQGRAAVETPVPSQGEAPGLVEVRYGVELGPLLTRVASPFLPRLSAWFDPTSPDAWVGHRIPLFAQGPIVLIVRAGISPQRLTGSP
jgi:hypothetical protein